MGINEYYKAYNLIEQNGNGDFDGEKSKKLIEKAENFLKIKFPNSYKKFLLELGCGDINGKEFYGIVNDNFKNSSIPNGIWLTQDQREKFNLDKNLLLIGQSIEGYYALDISKMDEAGECPVVDWHAGADRSKLEVIAEDFGSFFLNEVKEVL